jgi:hypothetical protein
VVRSPWDYTQRQAEWLAWLDSTVDRTPPTGGGPVFLPDAATLRWNGHKRYLLDLERRGIPVVPTRLLERGQDFEKAADEIARKNEWGCEFFIVKPAVGSFGNDVTMIKLGGRYVTHTYTTRHTTHTAHRTRTRTRTAADGDGKQRR